MRQDSRHDSTCTVRVRENTGRQSMGPIRMMVRPDRMIFQALHDSGPATHDPKKSQHGSLMPHKGAMPLKLPHNKEQTGDFE